MSPTEANSFVWESIPSEKGGKNENLIVASPEKIPGYLKVYMAIRLGLCAHFGSFLT